MQWIKGAIQHRGSLTRKATAAGQSPMAFAKSHVKAPGATGKQARLALTLQGLHRPKEGAQFSGR